MIRGRLCDESGSAASYVVLFPVLLVVFMALVQWGLYFHAQSLVDAAARRCVPQVEAAREPLGGRAGSTLR